MDIGLWRGRFLASVECLNFFAAPTPTLARACAQGREFFSDATLLFGRVRRESDFSKIPRRDSVAHAVARRR